MGWFGDKGLRLEEDVIPGWYVVPSEFFRTNYTLTEYLERKAKDLPLDLVR